jgi:hypothetical protein
MIDNGCLKKVIDLMKTRFTGDDKKDSSRNEYPSALVPVTARVVMPWTMPLPGRASEVPRIYTGRS